ncbi:dynamin family protein [Virgibacillus salexigens]|uniref:dynamin family protein n=1 Tax=Virgibacillus massiliensis TaxID=1462526 RepID=UPI00136F7D68|nr:dynamin family protein [Virgibacillus massiliensis]MYL42056.1 hypothetical protein [Virgibacillus massiliensis]
MREEKMGRYVTMDSTEKLLHQLAALYQKILDNKDTERAKKILDLYDKYKKQELMICFAGHFSAGKSSMINALLGKEILPNSPIPTSANIVKVMSGNGTLRVFYHHEQPVEYQEPYDMDMVKQYSTDKDTIRKLEIRSSQALLPKGTALIDTPGIDAADDADRLMTEASLHLMDALFYVMDYNHVQSEVNLQFLKDLQQKSIPFYIIINQIDKHQEEELAFKDFVASIKQTFDLWHIMPEKIFYSSLKDADVPHNQFHQIKQQLQLLLTDNKQELLHSVHAVDNIINQHSAYLQSQYEDQLAMYRIKPEQQQELSKVKALEREINDWKNKEDHVKDVFFEELNQSLKNAYLMPANLRDKAASYLESKQRDFKVGLFGSKKKTEEEKRQRTEYFLNHLQQTADTSLQWKLRDKWMTMLKQYHLDDAKLHEVLQHFVISIDQKDIDKVMKQGATLNGDYVIHYTNDLAATIKSKYKQKANDLWEEIATHIQHTNKQTIDGLQQQLTNLQAVRSRLQNYAMVEEELEKKQIEIKQLWTEEQPSMTSSIQVMEDQLSELQQSIIQGQQLTKLSTKKSASNKGNDKEEEASTSIQSTNTVDGIIDALERTTNTIYHLPGFHSFVSDLHAKKSRLQDRSYTIALFGAFSAGKSSFANALLGEGVLPVSPNPTTATVNRINPVNQEFEHGTVQVKVKSQESLEKDIKTITQKFAPKVDQLPELIDWITEQELYLDDSLDYMYQAYLKAVVTGYQNMKHRINDTIALRLDDFPSYVTDETKACYLESIDLYYDCELTRQGIRLVDTPGADSVNARHTNVAFEYIKHADAILYVTYYNHALNRADKDFLMQLGRVKESFQLDKMFFIVNASDLAEDQQELELVMNYVKGQLEQLGIRFPRLYPISSRNSLGDKQNNKPLNPEMQHFEDAFHQFIHYDLTQLTIASAKWDIVRTYDQLTYYIESQRLDQQQKDTLKQEKDDKQRQIQEVITNYHTKTYLTQINQKIEKQLYYVMERLRIRFHDMFKETFNPTTITESGKQAKRQLWDSLQNLINYCESELIRELQAVSLRIESLMKELAQTVYAEISQTSKQIDRSFSLPGAEIMEIETPAFQGTLHDDIDFQQFERPLGSFKNTKSFFEKNEKEVMKETIYENFQPFAKRYIQDNQSMMESFYEGQWHGIIKEMKDNLWSELQQHVTNYLAMITSTISIETLSTKEQELKIIVDNIKKKDGES